MTTQDKLEMTYNNLTKNMKKLNVKTEVASRELLKYAYTQNGVTLTTDSHRALKINRTVNNEFTKENIAHFEKIERLMNNTADDGNYYSIYLYRNEIYMLRKAAKFIKTMPNNGRLKTIDFKYEYNDGTMSVSVGNKSNQYQFNMLLPNFNSSPLAYMEHSVTTRFQAEYIADMLDFAYDSKLPMVKLRVSGNRMTPIRMIGEGFEYIALPVRTY